MDGPGGDHETRVHCPAHNPAKGVPRPEIKSLAHLNSHKKHNKTFSKHYIFYIKKIIINK